MNTDILLPNKTLFINVLRSAIIIKQQPIVGIKAHHPGKLLLSTKNKPKQIITIEENSIMKYFLYLKSISNRNTLNKTNPPLLPIITIKYKHRADKKIVNNFFLVEKEIRIPKNKKIFTIRYNIFGPKRNVYLPST